MGDRSLKDPNTRLSMSDMYRLTQLRHEKLKEALDGKYFALWECQFDRAVREELELNQFVKNFDMTPSPLCIRDALAGGRTEPIYTLLDCEPGSEQKIRYLDYCVSILFLFAYNNVVRC